MLGTVLADYLRQYEEDRQFDTEALVLVPVPLASRRLKERGYNQVERIARAALAQLSSRYHLETRLVARTKETEPQARLSRTQRLTTMDGAFALTGPVPGNATLILLDDVATTGSTLAAMETAVITPHCPIVLLALAH
jgi:predicted amidophosphoribosyltransferase